MFTPAKGLETIPDKRERIEPADEILEQPSNKKRKIEFIDQTLNETTKVCSSQDLEMFETDQPTFETLPNELIIKLLTYLDVKSLNTLEKLSTRMSEIIIVDQTIWRRKYECIVSYFFQDTVNSPTSESTFDKMKQFHYSTFSTPKRLYCELIQHVSYLLNMNFNQVEESFYSSKSIFNDRSKLREKISINFFDIMFSSNVEKKMQLLKLSRYFGMPILCPFIYQKDSYKNTRRIIKNSLVNKALNFDLTLVEIDFFILSKISAKCITRLIPSQQGMIEDYSISEYKLFLILKAVLLDYHCILDFLDQVSIDLNQTVVLNIERPFSRSNCFIFDIFSILSLSLRSKEDTLREVNTIFFQSFQLKANLIGQYRYKHNTKEFPLSVLELAAYCGNKGLVHYLVEKGATAHCLKAALYALKRRAFKIVDILWKHIDYSYPLLDMALINKDEKMLNHVFDKLQKPQIEYWFSEERKIYFSSIVSYYKGIGSFWEDDTMSMSSYLMCENQTDVLQLFQRLAIKNNITLDKISHVRSYFNNFRSSHNNPFFIFSVMIENKLWEPLSQLLSHFENIYDNLDDDLADLLAAAFENGNFQIAKPLIRLSKTRNIESSKMAFLILYSEEPEINSLRECISQPCKKSVFFEYLANALTDRDVPIFKNKDHFKNAVLFLLKDLVLTLDDFKNCKKFSYLRNPNLATLIEALITQKILPFDQKYPIFLLHDFYFYSPQKQDNEGDSKYILKITHKVIGRKDEMSFFHQLLLLCFRTAELVVNNLLIFLTDLLKNQIDINHKNTYFDDGNALHLVLMASLRGISSRSQDTSSKETKLKKDLVQMLLNYGANPNQANKSGLTPKNIAFQFFPNLNANRLFERANPEQSQATESTLNLS